MPASTPHLIIIASDGERWRVQLNGEALTVHDNEREARRSAFLLAERLRDRGRAKVELKLVASD